MKLAANYIIKTLLAVIRIAITKHKMYQGSLEWKGGIANSMLSIENSDSSCSKSVGFVGIRITHLKQTNILVQDRTKNKAEDLGNNNLKEIL